MGIQLTPMRTPISPAVRSTGCTASSAVMFPLICSSKSGLASVSALAIRSFRRTFPDRYSSAVTKAYRSRSAKALGIAAASSAHWMSRKITPDSSVSSSFSLFPESSAMYAISTRAFSEMETARASLAVSTVSTALCGLMVHLVNISALRSSFPSSSMTSSAQSR